MIRKILFLALACAAAMAQAQDVRRIGVLSPTSLSEAETRAQYSVFVSRLRELGYAEGRNLAIEWRFAEGKFDSLALLAGELVKEKVEVIVTSGTAATSAARRASATVPIVAVTFADPVASGFAESLAHPGRNVTGFSAMGSAVYEKRLALLIEALPGAKRIGVLGNPTRNFFLQVLPGLEAAAKKQGREIEVVNVRSERDLVEGFSNLATRRVDAVLVGDDRFSKTNLGAIAALALKYRMPSVFPVLRAAEQGGLIGAAGNREYRYQGAAAYVQRILAGEKAGDLPIEPPAKLDLAINQKTAAALGITLPPAIVARAQKVIE
jgi:putative ABC transport system substrate-binding protein